MSQNPKKHEAPSPPRASQSKRPKRSQFTDAEHEELDRLVLTAGKLKRILPSLDQDSIEPGDLEGQALVAALLLCFIADQSPKLDGEYGNEHFSRVEELVKQDSALLDLLIQSYRKRSFRDVRDLDFLNGHKNTRGSPQTEPTERGKAVIQAWTVPYEGDAHELLFENIKGMQRINDYENTVAIVQSSGMGKSRTIHEMASLVFTLPFNLRRPEETTAGMAYPNPDVEVGKYLRGGKQDDPSHTEVMYVRFLQAIFSTVDHELQSVKWTQESTGTIAPKIFAKQWRDYLETKPAGQNSTNRDRIYKEAVRQAEAMNLTASTAGAETADTKASPASTAEGMKQAFNGLEETLGRLVGPSPNKKDLAIVLYFDEAHVLCKEDEKTENKTLYHILCKALNNLHLNPRLFTVFLSTNSHVGELAPPKAMMPSARQRDGAVSLQAPITEMPFDCHPLIFITPDDPNLTVNSTSTVEFMSKFGRPLFWSLFERLQSSEGDTQASTGILMLAQSKLTNQNLPDEPKVLEKNDKARIACIDARLMLDYEPRREMTFKLESELVASHMRVAFSIPQSREYIRSGYPSEPIIAEAAAQAMRTIRHKCNPDAGIPKTLSHYLEQGIIDLGERGEVVARLLLALAYDAAVERKYPGGLPNVYDSVYSTGCTVTDFFEELLGPTFIEEVLDSLPNNAATGQTFRNQFKDATIRFTHFVRAEDDSVLTPEALFAAFVRGMAIICRRGQEVVDFIIPFLLPEANGVIAIRFMSAMLVQVKRQVKKGAVAKYLMKQEDIGLFPPAASEAEARPYITLVMELGVQPRPSQAKISKSGAKQSVGRQEATRTPALHPPTPARLKVIEPQRMSQRTQKGRTIPHPRYSVFAYGCSNTIYRVIKEEERGTYAALLAVRSMLQEHPRRGQSIDAIQRMKPLWSAGGNSFHWIRGCPKLSLPEDDTVPVPRVVAGKNLREEAEEGEREIDAEGNPFT